MEFDRNKIMSILIYIIIGLILIVTIFLLFSGGEEEAATYLDVSVNNTIFVGDNGVFNVRTDASKVKVVYKYGYLNSSTLTYDVNNQVSIPFTAIKSGSEEVIITADNQRKTINIAICDDIRISEDNLILEVSDTKEIKTNLNQECLSNYNFNITNTNIATIENNIIYAKNIGSTTLKAVRENKTLTFKINVGAKDINFDEYEDIIDAGKTIELKLLGLTSDYVCQTANDNIKVSKGNNSCIVNAIKGGNATITAVSNGKIATASIKVIDKEVSSISINASAIRINKGGTTKLNVTINPSTAETNIVWTSSNTKIASISSDGIVTGLANGVTTITAKSNNGKTSTADVIVTNNEMIATYDSSTLKYWITKGGTYYDVTYVWVEDAYAQFKMAITEPKNASSTTPRIPATAQKILDYLLRSNPSYSNKGFVAINASAMVSSEFGTSAPSSWLGTSQIPLILHDGNVIRDSSNEKIKVDGNYYIYGMKKDGTLAYYDFNHSGSTAAEREYNKNVVQKIKNDGVLYTFGFEPVLLWNGVVKSSSTGANIRQAICQVDKNTFILVTNTNSTSNRSAGFGFKQLGEYFASLNCKTALNLDGGGSTCLFYKKNNSTYFKVDTTYGSRALSDMIYFVEK